MCKGHHSCVVDTTYFQTHQKKIMDTKYVSGKLKTCWGHQRHVRDTRYMPRVKWKYIVHSRNVIATTDLTEIPEKCQGSQKRARDTTLYQGHHKHIRDTTCLSGANIQSKDITDVSGIPQMLQNHLRLVWDTRDMLGTPELCQGHNIYI